MRLGGIPEPHTCAAILLSRTLYDDVIHRERATRWRIGGAPAQEELAFWAIGNPTGRAYFNEL